MLIAMVVLMAMLMVLVIVIHHNAIFPVACGSKSDSTPSLEAVWVLSNNETANSKTESVPCQQVSIACGSRAVFFQKASKPKC